MESRYEWPSHSLQTLLTGTASSFGQGGWRERYVVQTYMKTPSQLGLLPSTALPFLITAGASALSVLFALGKLVFARPSREAVENSIAPDATRVSLKQRIHERGGLAIVAFRIVQLLGVLALLGLSVALLVFERQRASLNDATLVTQIIQSALFVSHILISAHDGLRADKQSRRTFQYSVSSLSLEDHARAVLLTPTCPGSLSSLGSYTSIAMSGLWPQSTSLQWTSAMDRFSGRKSRSLPFQVFLFPYACRASTYRWIQR